jgi:hypothetical protein
MSSDKHRWCVDINSELIVHRSNIAMRGRLLVPFADSGVRWDDVCFGKLSNPTTWNPNTLVKDLSKSFSDTLFSILRVSEDDKQYKIFYLNGVYLTEKEVFEEIKFPSIEIFQRVFDRKILSEKLEAKRVELANLKICRQDLVYKRNNLNSSIDRLDQDIKTLEDSYPKVEFPIWEGEVK